MKFFNKIALSTLLLSGAFTAGCDQTGAESSPDKNVLVKEVAVPLVPSIKIVEGKSAIYANHKVGCVKALEIINTCAYEDKCDSEMMDYLPSEPRGHLNALTEQSWFHSEAFTQYCLDACNAKSTKVDTDDFKFKVCGYAEDLSDKTLGSDQK